jgi:hypothetical protein
MPLMRLSGMLRVGGETLANEMEVDQSNMWPNKIPAQNFPRCNPRHTGVGGRWGGGEGEGEGEGEGWPLQFHDSYGQDTETAAL